MKTYIHINKNYIQYKGFIESLPTHNYNVEKVYCNHRNVVELVDVNGVKFVVKRYRKPIWFNRIAYTFFRKSKAERAYGNALYLLDHDITTPTPVAYIIQKKGGLFHTAWFVSAYQPYKPLAEVYPNIRDEKECDLLWKGLATFMVRMHQMGIFFLDNNMGNVLVHRQCTDYLYSLVDINRMEIGQIPSLCKAMRAFDQMELNVLTLLKPLAYYAEQRNFDLDRCVLAALESRNSRHRRERLKYRIKDFISLSCKPSH